MGIEKILKYIAIVTISGAVGASISTYFSQPKSAFTIDKERRELIIRDRAGRRYELNTPNDPRYSGFWMKDIPTLPSEDKR